MKSVVINYTLTLQEYRKMLYFNTFSIRRMQSLIVAVVWLAGATLLALDLFKVIEPTRIMHLCFLMVTVALPMIVVSLEIRIFRSRGADTLNKKRVMILNEKGISYRSEGKHETGLDTWDDLLAVYETRSLFLIYKDANNTVPVPKKEQTEDTLEKARKLFGQHLGNKFKRRF